MAARRAAPASAAARALRRRRAGLGAALLLAAALLAGTAAAEGRCVEDDTGREVCLEGPAQRIIALSPGVTELLFAAGAGERVVAAVSHADYPEPARELPRVGSYERLDLESLLAFRPDLVVAWQGGNSPHQLERLEEAGATLYRSAQGRLERIPATLERLGRLAGTEAAAREAAAAFRERLAGLRRRYAGRDPVTVFYEIWDAPLMTVNGEQMISDAIRICGGRNIFAELDRLAPRVDKEAVLAADPEAIVAGGMGGEGGRSLLAPWRRYESLRAARRGNLFFVDPALLQRPTPRVLEGTARLCEHLEQARQRR
ncbi:cobalamin-binding protein [Halorhodospira neutriphila]|uniref:Cobalamin-binding protein n=1 Tax=Halorhodospira neutriphila TaxID=168379 RepID=A0ABS1E7Q0_9GAMM|nr:cobalamin-binding protein [Halorhodospira neutriphila]MBK1727197.1 cobalamin-binding protein [Halorhodospira neutriphila]